MKTTEKDEHPDFVPRITLSIEQIATLIDKNRQVDAARLKAEQDDTEEAENAADKSVDDLWDYMTITLGFTPEDATAINETVDQVADAWR